MEQTGLGQSTLCSVCGKHFEQRFSYQVQEGERGRVAFCSARCQLRALQAGEPATCSACGARFVPEYAYQTSSSDGRAVHYCSMACRSEGPATERRSRRIAVYNLKGGTGKTTTAVALACSLSSMGYRVLLVDADPQGSVAVCLGLQARRGLFQVLVLGTPPDRCIVESRPNLFVIPASRDLAGAEVFLGSRPERQRVMHDRLDSLAGYDVTIIDCSPSAGLLSQNALRFADGVLVPVSCEYLGVVGLEQALRTVEDVEEKTGHRLPVLGVVPTFLDRRLNVCSAAMDALSARYGSVVRPPIRVSSKLKEAPSEGKTIQEHAPRSRGARDYRALARWLAAEHLVAPSGLPSCEADDADEEEGEET